MIVLCIVFTSTYTLFHALKVVTQGKNNKRGIGAGSQTPVPAKKAKKATPEKTGKIINLLHTQANAICTI